MDLLQRQPKGQVLVLVALLMLVIIGVTALAIDIGMAYGLKAKLSAAVDAAAIAAVRERTSPTGTDATADAAARSFLNANFPYQAMGVDPPICEVKIDRTDGGWTAEITATTSLRTRFASIIGWEGLAIPAKSSATKLDLDLALVLDSTGSLEGVFDKVQDRAIDFINRFSESNDRVAVVPFATGVSVNDVSGELVLTEGVEIKKSGRGFSKAAVNLAINNLTVDKETFTDSEFGVRMGLYELQKATNPAVQRAIVFFSDGAPNTFIGSFPLTTGANAPGSLFSGNLDGDYATRLFKAQKRVDKEPQSISLAKVPGNGGGNYIGTVQIQEIPVDGKRPIGFYDSGNLAQQKCDVNKAARNLLEKVASIARSQGIIIYSLGYGDKLDQPDISGDCPTSTEKGSTIMKRIANTPDSDTYDSNQPSGVYCYAKSPEDLGPCFHTIANAMLRLTK